MDHNIRVIRNIIGTVKSEEKSEEAERKKISGTEGGGIEMSRIKDLQKQVIKVLNDTEEPAKAMAHLHGVSLVAVMIAKKRGQNPELAAMAGLLHDLWAYKSGSYDNHAHLGADYARKVLEKMELCTQEEVETITGAIFHHDDKANIDAPFDEILKDADVIDHCLTDPTKEIKEKERSRYEKLCQEFGMEL